MAKKITYRDEFNNLVTLEKEDEDFNIHIKYNKASVGKVDDDLFLITRKDFKEMKKLDALGVLKE